MVDTEERDLLMLATAMVVMEVSEVPMEASEGVMEVTEVVMEATEEDMDGENNSLFKFHQIPVLPKSSHFL